MDKFVDAVTDLFRDAMKPRPLTLATMRKVDTQRYTQKRVRPAAAAWAHVLEHFGQDLARQVTADRLTAYVKGRKEEHAALATIATELAALRRGLNVARRANRVGTVPVFPRLSIQNIRTGSLIGRPSTRC